MGKYTIEYRKKMVLRTWDVGSLAENPYFVDGMTDYELEQEEQRYNAYCLEHGTNEGFVPIKIPEGRI